MISPLYLREHSFEQHCVALKNVLLPVSMRLPQNKQDCLFLYLIVLNNPPERGAHD